MPDSLASPARLAAMGFAALLLGAPATLAQSASGDAGGLPVEGELAPEAGKDPDAMPMDPEGLPVEEPLSPAIEDDDDAAPSLGQAGLLGRRNRGEDLPTLILSAGMPLAEDGLRLQSGRYYELIIEADGSQELALEGADFFRAIWVDEVVIEGIEIRPFGLSSMEFDEAGEAEISFVAVKPGTYSLGVPGSELQRISIVIE